MSIAMLLAANLRGSTKENFEAVLRNGRNMINLNSIPAITVKMEATDTEYGRLTRLTIYVRKDLFKSCARGILGDAKSAMETAGLAKETGEHPDIIVAEDF